MDPYIILLSCLGVVILALAWLPTFLRHLPLSLPILFVVFGFCLFKLPGFDPAPSPFQYPELTERLTELVVIISLMGAGLKINRPVGWRRWMLTWRLLAITMPLSIAGMVWLGWWALEMTAAAALLLGAVLAPTDPVLAADVQLGPPGSDQEDEVRFCLTSEAGLNDGLAFPFTHLAIVVAVSGSLSEPLLEWFAIDVVWRMVAGIAGGLVIGYLSAVLAFRLPEHNQIAQTGTGFVALGVTFLAYGVTELIQGYGFLAVFVAALTLRAKERSHHYHRKLHDFSEEMERLLMMVLLVLFGGALAGDLLAALTWKDMLVAFMFLFVIRPLAGIISLLGSGLPWRERLVISFFGIRGIGSLFYLAFALNHVYFLDAKPLWAVVGLVVLLSILLHGVVTTPIMGLLDLKRQPHKLDSIKSLT
jgi:NhaP-type Na+/H+ or K+/H+ antiporter